MFCTNCGKELPDNASFCPECGAAQAAPAPQKEDPQAVPQQPAYYEQPQNSQPQYQQAPYQQQNAAVDSGSFGWAVLGFCVPIVGLILFLVWKGDKPKSAKVAGIGALVSVILTVLLYVVFFIVGFAAMY